MAEGEESAKAFCLKREALWLFLLFLGTQVKSKLVSIDFRACFPVIVVYYCAKIKCKRKHTGICLCKTDWYMSRMELDIGVLL